MKNSDDNKLEKSYQRRDFLRISSLGLIGIGSVFGVNKLNKQSYRWQIDPDKCSQCGRCATHCTLQQSAVKAIHIYDMCGYCQLCVAYFAPGAKQLTEDAENQLCPAGAITRKYIEEPYYSYTISNKLCIGCGKCVKACKSFGNGSFKLQVDQEICLNCNECNIASNFCERG